MNFFLTTLESVVLLLGIGILGFFLLQRKILPEKALQALSPLALLIALPALVFSNIITQFSPQQNPDWWQLPVWWLVFTGFAAGLTALCAFTSKKIIRREFALSLFYQNGIFFPLAILSGMFGSESSYLTSLFLFTIFYPAFFFNTYPFFFGQKKKDIQWKKIFHPVLIVTIIAVALVLFGVNTYVPDFVVSITQMLGAMSIPLIMILLGGNIYIDYKNSGTTLFTSEIIKFVLLKNILFPLVFLALLRVLQPNYTIALLILLQSAVPPVTANPLVTERAGGNRAVVNQFLVASFLSSIVTLPVMMVLFTMYFQP
jgi:hypothetical protein